MLLPLSGKFSFHHVKKRVCCDSLCNSTPFGGSPLFFYSAFKKFTASAMSAVGSSPTSRSMVR